MVMLTDMFASQLGRCAARSGACSDWQALGEYARL